jgi:general secretion pathway protein M
MNGRIEAVRQWWLALSARERLMLSVLGVVLLAVVGWYGVATPLMGLSKASRERVELASTQLASLRALAASRPAGAAAPSAGTAQSLVEAAAGKAGVSIARRRQDANGRFTIWVSTIDARALLPWLASLERDGGVAVTDFTASRQDNGAVEAEITFAKASR